MSTGFALESPLFHHTAVMGSIDEARDLLTRLFARPIRDGGYRQGRWALFSRVGDALVEIMVPDEPAVGMRRFVERFGDHWHSLGWYVRNVDALADRLLSEGAGLVDHTWNPLLEGPVPRRVVDSGWWSAVTWSQLHAERGIHGLHEFCEPLEKHDLARWMGAEPLADDPLTIVGTSHVTTVVGDAEAAARFWVEVMGGRFRGITESPALGTCSSWVSVGADDPCDDGVLMEFTEPIADGPARDDLERSRVSILHLTTFRVSDLNCVRAHLAYQGYSSEVDSDDLVVTDPATTGIRVGFTTSALQMA